MATQDHVNRALEIGNEQAVRLLAEREEVRQRRQRVLEERAEGPWALTHLGSTVLNSAGAETAGTLVAEGDSWFHYPRNDVLNLLEDEFGYTVESVAQSGDAIEEMAYSDGQLEALIRLLEKLKDRDVTPRAVLLSGGGNDIAGDQFAMLLNHALSPLEPLSDRLIEAVIGERIQTAYVTILSAVTKVCRDELGEPTPILVHGYDHPVPDGRGVLGGLWLLPGPWLDPGFRIKGYADLERTTAIMADLIDRFNDMLESVVTLPEFSHVHYVPLRGILSNGDDYKRWWANELHPTQRGFRAVTEKFVEVLDRLP